MPRWSDLADRAPEWPLTQVPGPGISWVGGIGDGQVGVFWELVLDHSFRSCSDLLDFLNPGLSKLSALKKTMSYYVHNSFPPVQKPEVLHSRRRGESPVALPVASLCEGALVLASKG